MTATTGRERRGMPGWAHGPRGALAAVTAAAVGLALVAGGWLLPLWRATLHAPQYPGGLTMRAYGTRVTGDVDEIGSLNHYVGMRPFDPADVPEMTLWPLAVAVAAAAVLLALLARRRWVVLPARLYLWLLPVGVLAAIQLRLHQYGTDLDPVAALRIEPFTPLVIGPTRVWNFTTWSWPGGGLVCLLAAAGVVTFGPRLLQRLRGRRRRRRGGGALPATLLVALLAAVGGIAATQDHRGAVGDGGDVADHAGHDHHGGHVPAGMAPAVGAEHHGRDPAQLAARRSSAGLVRHATPLAERVRSTASGERLVLEEGVHRGPVVIDRPMVVEGRGRVVIEGDGTGSVVTIRGAGTTLRAVTVRGSGPGPVGDPAGVRVEADRVTVEDVIVLDSYMGIAVSGAAGVRIVDNVVHGRSDAPLVDDGHAAEADPAGLDAAGTVSHHTEHRGGRGDGIWLHDVDHVLVRGNLVEHVRDGVYVSFGSDALLDGNHVHGSRYAVHTMFARSLTLVANHLVDNLSGAVLMYGGPVLALRNHVQDSASASTGFALLLKDVDGAEVVQNVLVGNRVGLHLDGSADQGDASLVKANTIVRNAIGVSAYPSARAILSANSFVGNTIQVVGEGGRLDALVWSDAGTGNFWGTYAGYEGHWEGLGAVAHTEGGALDRLLARDPTTLALAGTPALRLLRAVEGRWSRRAPLVVDELPLTVPRSPAVAVPVAAPAAPLGAATAGAILLLPAVVIVATGARRPPQTPRRSPHALTI